MRMHLRVRVHDEHIVVATAPSICHRTISGRRSPSNVVQIGPANVSNRRLPPDAVGRSRPVAVIRASTAPTTASKTQ